MSDILVIFVIIGQNRGVTLNREKSLTHEGVRYSCNICNYNATHYSQKHKESVHVGVKYSCDICEYKAYFLVILNDTKNLFAKV